MQIQLRLVCISLVAVGLTFSSGVNGRFLAKITSPDKDEISRNCSTKLVVNCSVTSGGPAKFFLWKKDGKIIERSKPGVVQYQSVILRSSLSQNDSGTYECLAGDGTENHTDTLTVHVNCKPNILYGFKKHTSTPQILSVNDVKRFYCHAQGWPKPQFRWLKNGVQIEAVEYIRELHPKPDGLDLSFPSGVRKKDSGTYTCEATNIFGTSRYDVFVIVQDDLPQSAPVVWADEPEMTSTVGSGNVTLVCFGQLFIQKELTDAYWKLNNTRFDSNKPDTRIYYKNYFYKRGQSRHVKMSLIIQNVTLADSRNYTCAALTANGYDEAFVYLRVKKGKKTHPSGNNLLIPIAVSASVVVGLLVLVFLFRYYRRKSQYAMLCEKYDVDGKEYDYDAFVTYSSHNCQWVESNVVSFLEKNNMKCCIHYRNFEPGKCITENMAESVYSSRKVIVVLSKYYMESRFCKEELNFALYRSLEKGHRCIIVIRIDDTSINCLPKSLRSKTLIDLQNSQEQATWHKKLLNYVCAPAETTSSKLPFQPESSNVQDSNANVRC